MRFNAISASPSLRRAVGIFGVAWLALNLLEFPRFPYNVSHDLSLEAGYEYYAAHHQNFHPG